MNHTYNFKLCSTYTEKGKIILKHISFNPTYQNIIFYHFNINYYWDILHLFFLTSGFKIQSTFYAYSTSHFGSATFQVLSSHMWLVATILDRVALHCKLLDFMHQVLFIHLSSFLPSFSLPWRRYKYFDLPILNPSFTLILHILYLAAKYHFSLDYLLKYMCRDLHYQQHYCWINY